MLNPSKWPQARYGMPQADQVLINRHYIVGYSYYYRQAKWALEIIENDVKEVDRQNNFRSDLRIPEMFRVDKANYEDSDFDRGHLVSSANHNEEKLQNSETFLLSNMSPQLPRFNRGVWKKLESAVRKLSELDDVFETYVISGPIFDFETFIETVPQSEENPIMLPVPHAYFKSVLAERKSGAIHIWSFMLRHEPSTKKLDKFQVETTRIEVFAGLNLWDRLSGSKIREEKKTIRRLWDH